MLKPIYSWKINAVDQWDRYLEDESYVSLIEDARIFPFSYFIEC